MKSFAVVIPARLGSTRLPNKPLIKINGKTLIERTWNQVIKAVSEDVVFVLTDDELILNHCVEKNIRVVMTSKQCLTGTDRVAEFALKNEYDYYINVQGDEPLINPDDILKIISNINNDNNDILNGYTLINDESDYRSFDIPKVVFRPDGRLMYMSRASIPSNKQNEFIDAYKQVCIYAFPKKALEDFYNQKIKTYFENIEDIEILRFLELGYEVRMIELSQDSIAVDRLEDIDKVLKRLNDGSY
jgi:3-deoxy-manno-octulosonate cytidylyltransferase (CMP-KDO synthetase)